MGLKRLLGFLLVLVLFLPVVDAAIGVAHPVPSTFELLRGEEGRFKFQIQATAHDYDVECSWVLDGVSDLRVVFDVDSVVVPAGSSALVLGSVFVPDDAGFGVHEETFCVDCVNLGVAGGTQVLGRYCSVPVRVDVVPVRTKENVFVPPRPVSYVWVYVLVIAALIVLALIIYFVVRKKRKKSRAVVHKVVKARKPIHKAAGKKKK